MRQFITRKKVKIPRYKLYYFGLVFSVLVILALNLLMNLVLNHPQKDIFLNVLLGNSLGNVTKYQWSIFDDTYFYRNSFGLLFQPSEMVMQEHDSIEDIVASELTKVVYLYNTFQTTKYQSNYFSSYSIHAFITQASLILSEYLEEMDIGSVVEDNSVAQVLNEQDIPYTNSYAASKILLEKRVKENPSLTYYFDLQMSDYARDVTTVSIEGLDYAKVLFVVGTDNSNYQENQQLAVSLNQLLEKIKPELTRGISLRGGVGYQGIYNQDFSENALLIQVGGVENTIDEVNRTLKVLAEVIATYIKGEENEEK